MVGEFEICVRIEEIPAGIERKKRKNRSLENSIIW
jgi:hypothetical protein